VIRRTCAGSVLRIRLVLANRPHVHRRSAARGVPPRAADAGQGLSFVPPCQHRARHTRHPHHHFTTTSHCRSVRTLRGSAAPPTRHLCGHTAIVRVSTAHAPTRLHELNLGWPLPLAMRLSQQPTTHHVRLQWRDPSSEGTRRGLTVWREYTRHAGEGAPPDLHAVMWVRRA
jgi:hypothetical protein